MSDYHEKYSNIDDACEGLKLNRVRKATNAHLQLAVNIDVFKHIQFQLQIVDKTVNMGVCIDTLHFAFHRILIVH
jgi:hypothetical protein